MDVGGFTAAEADRMRRVFSRRDGQRLVAEYRELFIAGAGEREVLAEIAEVIFDKFNPHYMFPEGHAVAFAFTVYQMAWLRRYHPLEFFVALFNEQPIGFWDLGTLKHEARNGGAWPSTPTPMATIPSTSQRRYYVSSSLARSTSTVVCAMSYSISAGES